MLFYNGSKLLARLILRTVVLAVLFAVLFAVFLLFGFAFVNYIYT